MSFVSYFPYTFEASGLIVSRNNVTTVNAWLLNISTIQSPPFCYLLHYIKPVKHRACVVKIQLACRRQGSKTEWCYMHVPASGLKLGQVNQVMFCLGHPGLTRITNYLQIESHIYEIF